MLNYFVKVQYVKKIKIIPMLDLSEDKNTLNIVITFSISLHKVLREETSFMYTIANGMKKDFISIKYK